MHNAFVRVCPCLSVAEVLIKIGYWPNNPENPNMAFELAWLALMRVFLLEIQVSTKGFVESHRIVNDMTVFQVCNILLFLSLNIELFSYKLLNKTDFKINNVNINSFSVIKVNIIIHVYRVAKYIGM